MKKLTDTTAIRICATLECEKCPVYNIENPKTSVDKVVDHTPCLVNLERFIESLTTDTKPITFENYKDVCKYQDMRLKPLQGKKYDTIYYCDYNTPSTVCDCIENCPVLKTKEV